MSASLPAVIAHAYIRELHASKFQKEWSADALMKTLDRLHEDFYQKPRTMAVSESGVRLDEISSPNLTKADLKKLNGLCRDKLHRGSPEKYAFNATAERLVADLPTRCSPPQRTFGIEPCDIGRLYLCRTICMLW